MKEDKAKIEKLHEEKLNIEKTAKEEIEYIEEEQDLMRRELAQIEDKKHRFRDNPEMMKLLHEKEILVQQNRKRLTVAMALCRQETKEDINRIDRKIEAIEGERR